jgi:hypothetical protein
MSIIAIIKRNLRKLRIDLAEQDLEWSRASAASHARELNELRRAHDRRTSDEIRRDVERAAKAMTWDEGAL